MFRIVSALALALALCLTGFALAEEAAQAPENETSAEAAEEETSPWVITESIAIPAEVLALLEAATADPDGPVYEPEALLGEAEGLYCVLCRVRCGEDAAPAYTLVYVGADGLHNTWDLWVDEHAEPPADPEEEETVIDFNTLADDLLLAWKARESIDADVNALGGPAADVVALWNELYVHENAPDLLVRPEDLPAVGRHAIVLLGLELENGEMREELRGRCDVAAAAARACPDAILICSGGATGDNNPEGRTEAGVMKAYLSETCGIDPDRIFTDERAMTTLGNAVNTYVILREQGIESYTLVSSAYHLRRARILYRALDLCCERVLGFSCGLTALCGFDAEPPEYADVLDAVFASNQLGAMLSTFSESEEAARAILLGGGDF